MSITEFSTITAAASACVIAISADAAWKDLGAADWAAVTSISQCAATSGTATSGTATSTTATVIHIDFLCASSAAASATATS
jgi:hypothetical protein